MASSESSTNDYSDSENEVSDNSNQMEVDQKNKTQHAPPKQYKCPNCSKCYSDKKRYFQHLRSHLQYHPYECKVCLESFSLKKLLQAHKETHTSTKTYECSDCPKKFSHLSALNRHRMKHDEKPPYPCAICGEKFPTVSSRSRHVKNHIVSCPLCDLNFQDFTQLIQHIAEVHRSKDDDGPQYVVPTEPRKETGAEVADSSSDSDPEEAPKDFACFVCEQRFSSEESMTTHLKAHRLFMCSHCPQFFADKATLWDHEFTHTGKHPHKCDACQATFHFEKLLKHHQTRCKLGNLSPQNPNDLRTIMATINNAANISSDVKAQVESAIKTVLSVNATCKKSGPSVATQSLLKQIDPHAVANLFSENTPSSQDALTLQKVSAVLTRDLDESSTPAVDFSNMFHCYWLIRYLDEIRPVHYPLMQSVFWKIHHMNTCLVEQLGKTTPETACSKDNFVFLSCLQKKMAVILGSHFDSFAHKLP